MGNISNFNEVTSVAVTVGGDDFGSCSQRLEVGRGTPSVQDVQKVSKNISLFGHFFV